MFEFESPRLHFCKLLKASQQYVDRLNNPEVNRFLELRHVPQDLASCQQFIDSCNAHRASKLFGFFEKTDNRHIGNIMLGAADSRYQSAQVGLLIGERECWGKGYATEAILAISRYAFMTLGLKKLEAGCYIDNIGSLSAFLKAGYRLEGVQRRNVVVDGRRSDTCLIGLCVEDLAELK